MVIAALATMPERLQILEKAVASLRPQVDIIRVYLNNFETIPPFLTAEEGLLSKDAEGDLGDAGKFFWFAQGGFDKYLTADDDILYPPDYVARLVAAFESRSRKAIVGVHGFVFSEPLESYITSRAEKYKCTYEVTTARPVHVIGTATAILSQATLRLSLADFPKRNMADLQLALAAQKQQVPMIVIPRQAEWVQELQSPTPEHGFSIWKQTQQDAGRSLAAFAKAANPQWRLLPDVITE